MARIKFLIVIATAVMSQMAIAQIRYNVYNLKDLNTDVNDFGAIQYKDGLVFVSERPYTLVNEEGGESNMYTKVFFTQGKSIKDNQEKPHVHATLLSKDGKYLFVPDLGTDKINIYQVDVAKAQPLAPASQAFVSITPGGGPRHLTFHPNGKWAFLIQEMTGVITAFEYSNGKLTTKESVTLVSPGSTGRIDAADIHVSPDGNFLYGSLRGDINEIVVCSIDKSGKLAVAGRQSTLGKTPRNFAIDPTGKFLLVGNQNSDNIIVFKRDAKTGLLTATGTKISLGSPVCLVFTDNK